ncbi:MAG TPA: magnesium and cobalt transport protein CorA [Pseudonocardia sp.]|jgi:magnesium transporter
MSVVDNAIYVDGRRKLAPPSLDTALAALRTCPDGGRSFAWIGMLRPDRHEIDAVAHEFGLHELAVEDTVNQHQRPKLERYGETTFVVLRPARYVDPVEVIQLGELHLFLGPDFAVTVRHAEEPDLALVRKHLEEEPELLAHGPYAVLWGVLDRVVDDYLPVLQGLQVDIDEIEEQVFNGDTGVSKRIYQLTREVIAFHRAVEPLRDIFAQMRWRFGKNGEHSDVELRRRMRDVEDHATRVLERVENYRALLANLVTVNGTLVAQRQNEEMARMTEAGFEQNEQVKRISSWAAILFAPTLVAGIYGMNFEHMPELAWRFGYPFSLLLMVLLGLTLFVVFKRRGWL